MLAEIYGWFTEGFDTADLQEAKALLEALVGERGRNNTPRYLTPNAVTPYSIAIAVPSGFLHHAPRRLCYDGVA